MKLVTDKVNPSSWAFDYRVRERLLVGGQLDQKTVERHQAELPDLEAHAENLSIDQPALSRSGDGNGL